MKKIDSASGYLLGILNDILDMSKIESGKMKLVLDKCDIAGMIDNVTSIMDAKMNENDITFEQADDSANARKQGTGLGLAISNRLVHMMNSDIKLQSEVGVGSTFSFVVRLERVD